MCLINEEAIDNNSQIATGDAEPCCAYDIHHHYVPIEVIGEVKRHGKALGIDVAEVGRNRACFFQRRAKVSVAARLDGNRRASRDDEKGKIALAVLDPSTQWLGYELEGER